MLKTFVIFVSVAFSATVSAQERSYFPAPEFGNPFEFFVPTESLLDDTYRIGDEWGKVPVSQVDFKNTPQLISIVQGTAFIGGGTGFYLGEFNGHHVFATNHHVCPSAWRCSWGGIRFTELGFRVSMDTFYGSWPEIDLALLSIEVSESQAQRLQSFANPFAFDIPIGAGQELATAGFGTANNRDREMVINIDSDCKTFSQHGDFRQMADPDELNPGPYEAWSFANGCDVSHGDSGSAMVDRDTGEVVGLIWTGRIPKDSYVQDSSHLEQMLASDDPRIWSELSYAVPAPMIQEYLTGWLEENPQDPPVDAILRAILSR